MINKLYELRKVLKCKKKTQCNYSIPWLLVHFVCQFVQFIYCEARNFRGIKFLWIGESSQIYNFCGTNVRDLDINSQTFFIKMVECSIFVEGHL